MNIKNRVAVIEALKRLMGVEGPLSPDAEHALVLLAYGISSYTLVDILEDNEDFKKILTDMLQECPDSMEVLKVVENAVATLSRTIDKFLAKQLEG